MSGPVRFVMRNREKFLLVGYAIAILIFASLLSPMLGQAWQRAELTRALFQTRLLIGLSLEIIAVVLVSLFFGLLGLMILDTKKRFQGVLLFVGSIVGLLALSSMGLLLPNIDLFGNIQWVAAGLVVGGVVGGGRSILDVNSNGPREFRSASRAVYFLLSALMVVGFLEYHLEYPFPLEIARNEVVMEPVASEFAVVGESSELLMNAVLVGAFIVTTKRFVQYDAERDFFVLGPTGSGKSLFLVGAYLEALERFTQDDSETPLNPSQDLINLVGALDRQGDGWFVEATRAQELEDLHFQYVHGNVFPKNVEVSSLDYAGEWLEDIPDIIMGTEDADDPPNTLKRVADNVRQADTLILLIDSNRWLDDEPLEIEPYFDIVQATEEKNVILIATKADVLAEQFRSERGLDAQQYFPDFKEYVNEQLGTNQTVQSLLAQAGSASEIHPVYYQTTVDDSGERVPMRANGTVTTVGFDELLDMVGEN
ncbi:hypothetical protein [Candidatus Halobonum tyrrellensis]|uniref:Uncharacterized protein n=1 Tax=Candidatus Halobonum tyrrellensis G22 TaxID=1324957 RepID=V4HG95_9EURY|nr:hypothetical protein [Candidatus Halobonum tyrrellensis]ESP86809.1 hypothetical protein K933_17037 [Candidatus Halobonum tyrrellensis G22]